MNYIEKHLTTILIITFILILISPFLLTLHGLECFNFKNTGDIGSTIGGITSPIVGLFTILLLYITLRAQQNFNNKQQNLNEITLINSYRENFSFLSHNITFVVKENLSKEIQYKGSFFIERLQNSTNPSISINLIDFESLFNDCAEIANIGTLFFETINESSIDSKMKELMKKSLFVKSETVMKLFTLLKDGEININLTLNNINYDNNDNTSKEDETIKYYKEKSEKIISEFNKAYEDKTNKT